MNTRPNKRNPSASNAGRIAALLPIWAPVTIALVITLWTAARDETIAQGSRLEGATAL